VLAELKSARLADCGRTCAELDVPFVVVEDSAGIEAHARESGLVAAGAAQAVAASIRAERSREVTLQVVGARAHAAARSSSPISRAASAASRAAASWSRKQVAERHVSLLLGRSPAK
jgi:hypothetical protein